MPEEILSDYLYWLRDRLAAYAARNTGGEITGKGDGYSNGPYTDFGLHIPSNDKNLHVTLEEFEKEKFKEIPFDKEEE